MIHLLAFWQFTSLAMLGWAAAALAPILIHLLTRKRFRRVTWAAMEYLLAAAKKSQRRIQLEHWLLLAVRTLLLLILAMALADPVFSRTNLHNWGGAVPPTHHVFVMDASYSMDQRRNGATRFEAAKAAIRERVEKATQGDGFSLVLIAEPPRVIVGEPAFSKDDLLEELDAVKRTDGLGDLSAALGEADAIMASARKQHSRLAATRLVMIGDLERTTWQPLLSDAIRAQLKKLAKTASIALVDLGSDDTRNAAILHAEVRESPVTIDREFTLQAEVAAFGEGPGEKNLATLLVDDEVVLEQAVELDSGGRGIVTFRHRFATPGDHSMEVRLADDALLVDNHRWISVPVRERLKVLCVYSRPGETRYVALALEPERSPAARIEAVEAADTVLLEKDLTSYDAVFLVNLPQLDTEQVQVLRSYVSGGGGLVIFPGDLLKVNEFLPPAVPGPKEQASAQPLLPVEFAALSSTGDYRFAPLDYRHELVEPFRGFERAGLLTTPVWKYVKLKPLDRADVQTALAFDSGDPAIVESRLGRGRIVVFATAASPDSVDRTTEPLTPWSALATWPSFPPLIQETLSLVARGREEGKNRLVGEPLSSLVHAATPDTQLMITTPTAADHSRSAPRPIRLESAGDVWRWSFGETEIAGLYEVKMGAPLDRIERFAMNIDPRESALQRIDSATLPAEVALQDVVDETASRSSTTGVMTSAAFRPLLLAVLLLLALESFLARWFGGGRS